MQLSQETYERLKEEIESKVMGATNSEAEYHALLVLIAEDIKMETVYHLHQAIEEGQRDIWYAVQEEEYRRSNFAV